MDRFNARFCFKKYWVYKRRRKRAKISTQHPFTILKGRSPLRNVGLDVLKYFDSYEEASQIYSCNDAKMLQYLHNHFDGEPNNIVVNKSEQNTNNIDDEK